MGHASLHYLMLFNVSAIKIDGSITRDILNNPFHQDIISSITNLKNTQGVHIVAEFVETEEQRQELIRLGCNYFQGYYHSPALSEEEFLLYCKKHL
jgi:EAL domain-containing protein (putative c-di-GMP-specific phosphodiesterase class I)